MISLHLDKYDINEKKINKEASDKFTSLDFKVRLLQRSLVAGAFSSVYSGISGGGLLISSATFALSTIVGSISMTTPAKKRMVELIDSIQESKKDDDRIRSNKREVRKLIKEIDRDANKDLLIKCGTLIFNTSLYAVLGYALDLSLINSLSALMHPVIVSSIVLTSPLKAENRLDNELGDDWQKYMKNQPLKAYDKQEDEQEKEKSKLDSKKIVENKGRIKTVPEYKNDEDNNDYLDERKVKTTEGENIDTKVNVSKSIDLHPGDEDIKNYDKSEDDFLRNKI